MTSQDPSIDNKKSSSPARTSPLDAFCIDKEPYYLEIAGECSIFEAAFRSGAPLMLKGPTGCGKTRFLRHMAYKLGKPLITVACHEDLSGADLTGRFLLQNGETVWHDGPLTMAARLGAICYLDEVVEARKDTLVLIHPLTDDRRLLPLDQLSTQITAHPDFMLVISYNPGYQSLLKELKPSTRQRFIALALDYAPPQAEAVIVASESGTDSATAEKLVSLAGRSRELSEFGLAEGFSTRLLVYAAVLMRQGVEAYTACITALAGPATDDPELTRSLRELVADVFPASK